MDGEPDPTVVRKMQSVATGLKERELTTLNRRSGTMRFTKQCLMAALAAGCMMFGLEGQARAQFPIVVTPPQPVLPAVVGYSTERRGLFGQRVVMRPLVSPVATLPAPPVVVAARPVVTATAPPVITLPPAVSTSVGYTTYYTPSIIPAAPLAVPLAPVPVTSYLPATWMY